MEKIVKLEELNWVSGRDAVTIALCNTIIRKQNEIIDYLNIQPQAGVFTEFTDKNISDDIPKGFVDIDGKLHKFEYNPEKKGEWVEKLWELIDVYRDSKDINSELEGIEEVNQYVKQLLDEREREAEKNLLKRFYNATSKEEFRDVLDKLNNK